MNRIAIKNLIACCFAALATLVALADTWTDPDTGYTWTYRIDGNGAVDESKLGENPCGLKLSYKMKDGTFRGSFKVYVEVGGKARATTVKVSGFLLDGIGYGTATVKGRGDVSVTIE